MIMCDIWALYYGPWGLSDFYPGRSKLKECEQIDLSPVKAFSFFLKSSLYCSTKILSPREFRILQFSQGFSQCLYQNDPEGKHEH